MPLHATGNRPLFDTQRAFQVFLVYGGYAPRLYLKRLSPTTARRAGVLHCETEPLYDKRCTAS